jgi:hypothetical protein
MLRYTGQEASVEHDLARTTRRCSGLVWARLPRMQIVLPPSSGCKPVGTTPSLSFRVLLGRGSEGQVKVAL